MSNRFAWFLMITAAALVAHGEISSQVSHAKPTEASQECTVQAAAYAAALSHLQAARQVADDAYQKWYDCEHGTGTKVTESPAPGPEFSILVQ